MKTSLLLLCPFRFWVHYDGASTLLKKHHIGHSFDRSKAPINSASTLYHIGGSGKKFWVIIYSINLDNPDWERLPALDVYYVQLHWSIEPDVEEIWNVKGNDLWMKPEQAI